MYARKVEGRTLTLMVSGMLWENSLVMQDLETKSYWSHLLGEAMKGKLTGQRLEVLPSLITDWQTWQSRHPETTVAVLSRKGRQYRNRVHRRGLGDQMGGLVIGLAQGETAKDWSFSQLRQQPLINSHFDGQPVLVCYHAASGTAVIFSRLLDGRELTFELLDDQLTDHETGTKWDMVTGRAVAGPAAGSQLIQLPGIVSLASPWSAFHVFGTSAAEEFEPLRPQAP